MTPARRATQAAADQPPMTTRFSIFGASASNSPTRQHAPSSTFPLLIRTHDHVVDNRSCRDKFHAPICASVALLSNTILLKILAFLKIWRLLTTSLL